MTASARLLASVEAPRKRKAVPMLHSVESEVADRIKVNAAALRAALFAGHPIGRRMLTSLAEDMDAWVRALNGTDAEAGARMRSSGA